MAKLVQ